MMTSEELIAQARTIQELNNLPPDVASYYAALIGDTICLAEDGRVIVDSMQGREIARVWLTKPAVSNSPNKAS